jgi:pimeloyl-ACP methyl ester carboxylesterase
MRSTARGVMRLCVSVTSTLAIVLVALALPTPTQAAPRLVDIPVEFTVRNVNRTAVPCGADGGSYTVRGHLTGPVSALRPDTGAAVALYLHGLEVGEWFWRFPAHGYNHALEMARLGHVSLTIDRLGYPSSGQPPGLETCVGSQADAAHQIIQQLRQGSYQGSLTPAFARVATVGHSLGGAIAEVEAYTFRDVDGVVTLSYADTGLSLSALTTPAHWTAPCALGTSTSPKGAAGYAYFTANLADYQAQFLSNTPASLLPEAVANRNINPCGDMMSLAPAIVQNLLRISSIKVPVLIVTGTEDRVFDASRFGVQRALFADSRDARLVLIDGGTHGITLEPTAPALRSTLDDWFDDQRM